MSNDWVLYIYYQLCFEYIYTFIYLFILELNTVQAI